MCIILNDSKRFSPNENTPRMENTCRWIANMNCWWIANMNSNSKGGRPSNSSKQPPPGTYTPSFSGSATPNLAASSLPHNCMVNRHLNLFSICLCPWVNLSCCGPELRKFTVQYGTFISTLQVVIALWIWLPIKTQSINQSINRDWQPNKTPPWK